MLHDFMVFLTHKKPGTLKTRHAIVNRRLGELMITGHVFEITAG